MSVKSIFAPSASTKSSGAGLSGVFGAAPTQEAVKIANLQQESQQATAASNEANSVSGIFKNTISGIWDTVKGVGSGLVSAYTNPDPYEQSMEQSAPPVLRQITAPILRTFAPLTENLNKDIVSAIIFNNPTLTSAFDETLKVPESQLTPAQKDARESIIAAPQKSPIQIVGDVSQAVLGAYAPELFGESLGSGLAAATARNAQIGFTYGLAQAASSGETDPKKLGQIVLQSTVGGAVLGLATEGVARGVARSVPEAIDKIQAKHDAMHVAEAPEITVPPEATAKRTQTHAEYARSQGYEPYTPIDELPTIDYGTKAKSELPTIEAGIPKARAVKGDLTYEPIPDVLRPIADQARKATSAKEFVATVEKNVTPAVEKAVKTRTNTSDGAPTADALEKFYKSANTFSDSEKTVSGLAQSVKNETIQAGLQESIGKLPEYGVMNMKNQAAMARSLIEKDPAYAMQVARGEVPPPDPHLLSESVYSAFRVLARESDDVHLKTDIYRQLAEHSNTTAAARAAGQRIKALDSGIRNDPLDIIQEVKDAREKNVENKSKGATLKEKKHIAEDIKVELKRAAPTRQSWEEFIDEIQCKY